MPASANKVLFICGVRESWAAAPRLVLRTSPGAPGTSCTLHPHPRVARSPGAPPCVPPHPTCSCPQARAGDGLPAKPRNSTCGHNLHLHFPRGTTALAPNTAPLSVRHKKMLFHEVLFPSPKGISLSISAPVKFWAPFYPRPRQGTNTSCTVTPKVRTQDSEDWDDRLPRRPPDPASCWSNPCGPLLVRVGWTQ